VRAITILNTDNLPRRTDISKAIVLFTIAEIGGLLRGEETLATSYAVKFVSLIQKRSGFLSFR